MADNPTQCHPASRWHCRRTSAMWRLRRLALVIVGATAAGKGTKPG
jgi:hypothetical protein